MDRRDFLLAAGATALEAAVGNPARLLAQHPQRLARPDFALRIASVSVELAPGVVVRTTGYNGVSPGPLLRMREGVPITVEVSNELDHPELVHWHGQFVSPAVDGSAEEGTPAVPARGRRRYTFAPRPAGTRWYHTHTFAGADLTRGMYSGQFGFVYIEPKSDPGRNDREIFLAIHQWEPFTTHLGPPNNGFEIGYQYASFNGHMLGHGEPIRVRPGERVLFRLLNASATDDLRLALPGHRFRIVGLDGNPVPAPREVGVLEIGVAERIDAVVEMNQPGVWIFGSVKPAEREKGMGVVVEYANRKGAPQWSDPPEMDWDYALFGSGHTPPAPDARFEMLFRKIPGERVRFNSWTINGKSFPDAETLAVEKGRRYRLAFRNDSGDTHPLHLHRHSFEVVNVAGKPMAGIMKDVVLLRPRKTAEVDFIADNPGMTLFHCHAQHHMDFGFMELIKYA
jgi:FtsP/CotA-like multicopper oxidase with cupredoxin domain